MLKRLAYLPYYILKTPKSQFNKYFDFVKEQKHVSSLALFKDILTCSVKYNISLMDYFQLRFYEHAEKERAEYAGTGFMYEYQLYMNPKKYRDVLEDKIKFLNQFKDFSGRKWATLEMLENNPQLVREFIENPSGKIVLKNSTGQAGKEVEIFDSTGLEVSSLLTKMRTGGYDLIETFVVQHQELMRLAPTALNTLRIVTQISGNQAIIITARLRISVNSNVDNLTAGNCAAPIDIETGIVCGPGVYGDITKQDAYEHPVTGVAIVGFQIPFWKECLQLVTKAALMIPENRSIGWDIAITNDGPILIEGNHNWGRVLWQLPEKKGLKKDILKYYV
ncbi:MAG: hexapeptide transferase [Bacteroidota bacterium]|nr:hexapeptide transferase [Bacteroidota bacterium]